MTTRTFKRKNLPFRQIGPHCLIVHGRNSMTLKSNEVGGLIWECLEEENDIAGIVAKVKEEYPEADDAEVTRDVEEFVEKLLETTAIDVVKGEPFSKEPQLRKLENVEETHPHMTKGDQN